MKKILILFILISAKNLFASESYALTSIYSSKLDKEIIFKFGAPTNAITIETSTYFTYRLNLYCSVTFRFRNHKLINSYIDLEDSAECNKFRNKFFVK
jgi:hypothetical protein